LIQCKETPFQGLFILSSDSFHDERGSFKKVLSKDDLLRFGLSFDPVELYYSINKKNVIRGMHFQVPPKDHDKLVYVIAGEIVDVCLDLRSASPTYGRYFHIQLSGGDSNYLFIPRGIAHGFASLSDYTIVHYAQTTCYSKDHDCGIRYDSFGFNWPVRTPILSERDANFEFFNGQTFF